MNEEDTWTRDALYNDEYTTDLRTNCLICHDVIRFILSDYETFGTSIGLEYICSPCCESSI